jgi:hypothetical protein
MSCNRRHWFSFLPLCRPSEESSLEVSADIMTEKPVQPMVMQRMDSKPSKPRKQFFTGARTDKYSELSRFELLELAVRAEARVEDLEDVARRVASTLCTSTEK